MDNPYANLQFSNPGNAFMQAFQQGQANRREGETRNALMKYAQNPDDPEVFSELAKFRPELAIQLRGQQQQQHQAALAAHRDDIIKGAQIFRELGVKDEATYQQAIATARNLGIDVSQVPPNFDPQYVNGVVAIANSFAPQKGGQGTALQQNYEFLKQQNPQLADSYLKNQAEGAPLIASNGDGTFTIVPRSMAGGTQAPPPPPPGFVIDGQGGPTPSASGGFPNGPL